MNPEIQQFNESQLPADRDICNTLAVAIGQELTEAECKIWHAHPVWFLEGNPTAGYSKEKNGVRLMFWSGADFDEERLTKIGKTFKDASIYYNDVSEINIDDINRWLQKSREIQWDYKNVAKRKGKLVKL